MDAPDLTQTLDLDFSVLKKKPSTPNPEVWGTLIFLSPPYNRLELIKVWFGRHAECDVKITDNHISGKHCVLLRQRRNRGSKHTDSDGTTKQVWIVDHSSNGTYINGRKLEKGAMFELHHRDEVSLVVPSSQEAMKSPEFKNTFTAFVFELAQRNHSNSEHSLMRSLTMDLGKKGAGSTNNTNNSTSSPHNAHSPAQSTASGLMPPPAARPRSSRTRYYSVDEQALVRHGARARPSCGPNVTVLRLQRPHVADTHYAAEQFKMAELAFRRFVNRDRMFSVKEVDVIINQKLEQAYASAEQQLSTRPPIDLDAQYGTLSQQPQRRVMEKLVESIWWSTETEDRTRGSNPVLAWHGTTEQNIASIAANGFEIRASKDAGWYGRGIYFTQLPNYGEFYINNCLSEMGDQFSLILSWVLLGRPFPVVTKLDGQGCMPGYDSHVCLVNGFLPCGPNDEPTGDEIVVFRAEQVLPRYVVHYEIKKKAKFVPIALFDSSDEEDDDDLVPPSAPSPSSSSKLIQSPATTAPPPSPAQLGSPPLGGSTTAVDSESARVKRKRAFSLLTSADSVPVPEAGGSASSVASPASSHTTVQPSPQLDRSASNLSLGPDEVATCAVRAKLFSLSPEGSWQDVGVGTVRVISDPRMRSARIVQHMETTGNVILNAQLLAGMVCERPTEKAVKLAVIDPTLGPQVKLLRVGNTADCTSLYSAITAWTAPQGVEDAPLRRVLSLSHSSSALPKPPVDPNTGAGGNQT